MKGETVWRIIHLRWDIENSGINELKNSWNLRHCYDHNVTAIEAIILILLMVVNLFTLFVEKNLKVYRLNKKITKVSIIEQFKNELALIDKFIYHLYVEPG